MLLTGAGAGASPATGKVAHGAGNREEQNRALGMPRGQDPYARKDEEQQYVLGLPGDWYGPVDRDWLHSLALPVRAEKPVHGSDQQSCHPSRPTVMITGHVPAVYPSRRSTATSCRSTSTSAFLEAGERPSRTSQPHSRVKIR